MIPRITPEISGSQRDGEQTVGIGPHVQSFPQGDYFISDAADAFVGTIDVDGVGERICITALSARGKIGLLMLLSPDMARGIASHLVGHAQQLESDAAAQASDAIDRARRK